MKFVDPMPVMCDRCATESHQAVTDLLRLRATCPACGASFAETGLWMRKTSDEVAEYSVAIEIAMNLEPIIGKEISDAELSAAKSLRDFARIVQTQLQRPDGEAVRITVEAARKIYGCTQGELDLDATLVDAIHPDRWRDA